MQKTGATRETIDALVAEINEATQLTIAIEGRYGWVAFLPSRQNPDLPVPNRYFGAFEDGTLKFRGIELRRSDQAPFIKSIHRGLLDLVAQARTLADCQALRPALLEAVREAKGSLRRHEVPAAQLLLRRKTSKEAGDYRNNSMTAVAARQAVRAGVRLNAG